MLDITLRPLKDQVFDPLCSLIPQSTTPGQLTFAAFVTGLLSCVAVAQQAPFTAVSLWLLNRALDCLDGAIARQRNQSTDLGGFLDLLGDFVIYSLIPICCALGGGTYELSVSQTQRLWAAVACSEASFHVNNFVLFYIAAITEKQKAANAVANGESSSAGLGEKRVRELTSLSMKPALVEGAESGLIFTIMLIKPEWAEILCWMLTGGVAIGTVQRVMWVVDVL
ncbi:hypothetical protein KC363_g6193 [Hortaea werneckii]|uniref:CDP-alcohol phosphatidyltransferase n=1 Tax=Hortaea werneckii TaxID=91943 RepID=A0A3M7FEM9_HORWE|nr:hypothetical protein KC361_g6945 [Hortaea werneckii]KAI6881226.1 hypothetical protein KC325_g6650 [Hortaea werneckii]KAI6989293.1 hypothetical protein KC359_g7267 [Hortaea werneckii]KAI7143023.1 hypothetical protein KC344_g6671 [Hortaea werneckii]KAI7170489.1 hypothetical protein KC360_g6761 [Hortaea werneckii]